MRASSPNWITFNPGPSQIQPRILSAITEIAGSGLLSKSHRSEDFSAVSQQAIEGLRKNMGIPSDYAIFYQPSATAAMETTLRNCVRKKSFHFVHGAFSELFFKTASAIGLESTLHETEWGKPIDWNTAVIPDDHELIGITHCETSTGLMWPLKEIVALREKYPTPLLAIDVTTSFGAVKLPWNAADIWFWSVQKCLGLPSGLGLIIVSPRALEKGKAAKGVAPWQSFTSLSKKMELYQTPETPNIFAISLLAQLMTEWNLEAIEAETVKKARLLYDAPLPWKPFVQEKEWRSTTVANLIVDNPAAWHKKAEEAGITLGKGYSLLKENCIRIANFPAITSDNIQRLVNLGGCQPTHT